MPVLWLLELTIGNIPEKRRDNYLRVFMRTLATPSKDSNSSGKFLQLTATIVSLIIAGQTSDSFLQNKYYVCFWMCQKQLWRYSFPQVCQQVSQDLARVVRCQSPSQNSLTVSLAGDVFCRKPHVYSKSRRKSKRKWNLAFDWNLLKYLV